MSEARAENRVDCCRSYESGGGKALHDKKRPGYFFGIAGVVCHEFILNLDGGLYVRSVKIEP